MGHADSILFNVLYSTEEERYKSYFKQDYWSVDEFCALIVGLDPTRFVEIVDKNKPANDKNEGKRVVETQALANIFLKHCIDIHKENPFEPNFLGKDLNLSCWRYIKWIAENNIPMRGRFLKALSLDLLELLEEFEPINIDLRTAHRYSLKYHKARFLQHAKRLIQRAYPQRISRAAIYRDPSSQNLLREFVKSMGAKQMYSKRAVEESWLPEIDPNPPRGAPFKIHKKDPQ